MSENNEEILKKRVRGIKITFGLFLLILFIGVIYFLNNNVPGGLKSVFRVRNAVETEETGDTVSLMDRFFEKRIVEDSEEEEYEEVANNVEETVVDEPDSSDQEAADAEPAEDTTVIDEQDEETEPEEEPVYGDATLQIRGPTVSERSGKVRFVYQLNLNSIAARRYSDGLKYSFNMDECPSAVLNSSDNGFSGTITNPKIGDNTIVLIVDEDYLESKTSFTRVGFTLSDAENEILLSGRMSAPSCE